MKDIYTLTKRVWMSAGSWSPYELDAMWVRVEREFASTVASLAQDRENFADARSWLRVLVEFAAQIFVRGADFGTRLVNRIAAISPQLVDRFNAAHSDHINGARLLELHRLRGAILQAEWTVLRSANGSFITNDIARTPVMISEGRVGYLIPLRRDVALLLTFGPTSSALHIRPADTEDKWVVGPIHHEAISDSQLARFNALLAYSARSEIYGGAEAVIRSLHAAMNSVPVPLEEAEPVFLAFYRDLGDTREYEQLFLLVHTPPSQCQPRFDHGQSP